MLISLIYSIVCLKLRLNFQFNDVKEGKLIIDFPLKKHKEEPHLKYMVHKPKMSDI